MSITRQEGRVDGRRTRTRSDIIEALKLYAELYGDDFTQAAFSPSAAKWNDRPDLVERYYNGMPDGRPWPSLNGIKIHFNGSWNEAREAAGLPPNTPGPAGKRRPAGTAQPIRTVRERRVFVEDERLDRLTRDRRNAEERAERAETRSRVLAGEVADLRHELKYRPVTERVVERRVRTTESNGKVERLRAQLADERAAFRAFKDQAKAAERERDRAQSKTADADSRLAVSELEARRVTRERDSARERLTSVEALLVLARTEVEELQARDAGAVEAAAVSSLVRVADARAEAAERRAELADREALAHAAAATGEARKLSPAELEELRSNGPAGPALLAAALKQLSAARKHQGNLDAALLAVARSAVDWRSRLGPRG